MPARAQDVIQRADGVVAPIPTDEERWSTPELRPSSRPLTRHPAPPWQRARRTGTSRSDGERAFSDLGLIVQDAGVGQRWMAREHLADYLHALLADDLERPLLLTRPLEAA